MITREPVPTVHSVAEAYLFIMLAPCAACGRGPFKPAGDIVRSGPGAATGDWRLPARCGACGEARQFAFTIDPLPTREQARSDVVNPTAQASRAIDLLGWLTLFQTILSAADRTEDKSTARQLAREAAQCLDEALKFYEGGNELPTDCAFFNEDSRRRFRDHPQRFARTVWRERRLKLPEVRPQAAAAPRRRWWRFWHAGDGA
jgi:hypothetical protein